MVTNIPIVCPQRHQKNVVHVIKIICHFDLSVSIYSVIWPEVWNRNNFFATIQNNVSPDMMVKYGNNMDFGICHDSVN